VTDTDRYYLTDAELDADPRQDLAAPLFTVGELAPVTPPATVDLIARVAATPYVATGHDGLCFCVYCLGGGRADMVGGGE
jgi:hypothetical protein